MAEKIETNYRAAKKVAAALLEMKWKGWSPFDRPDEELFPDSKVPQGMTAGTKEHALYLLHSVSIDSMRQADEVYRAMQALTENFELADLHKTPRNDLIEVLGGFLGHRALMEGKASMTDPIRTLTHNSRWIKDHYQGDPRNLLAEGGDDRRRIKKTIENIDALLQYGPPKAALLMKNMVRFGVWDLPRDRIPIKIDRHLLRISVGAGVVDAERYARVYDWSNPSKSLRNVGAQLVREGYFTQEGLEKTKIFRGGPKIIRALTDVYQKVCVRERWDAVELDDAKWAVGAYNCKRNDSRYCLGNCLIGCGSRVPSDNNACYFFIETDKRNNNVNLFSQK